MKSFFCKLFGTATQMTELEKLILNNIRDRLTSDTARLWEKQVQAINKVQRLPEGIEADFYRMKKGRPSFDNNLAFANKTDELLVAKVRIELPNGREPLTASVWCVKGFLFSIEYDGSVSYFEEAIGTQLRSEVRIMCELVTDLEKK